MEDHQRPGTSAHACFQEIERSLALQWAAFHGQGTISLSPVFPMGKSWKVDELMQVKSQIIWPFMPFIAFNPSSSTVVTDKKESSFSL